jgi:hypothetical protein
MLYAPRALRHFSLAAMEARGGGSAAPRLVPPEARPIATHPSRRTIVRLWLPLTPLFLLLAPFALLLTPLLYFVPQRYGARPLATVLGVGGLLLSLSGTVVEVDTPDVLVLIRIL